MTLPAKRPRKGPEMTTKATGGRVAAALAAMVVLALVQAGCRLRGRGASESAPAVLTITANAISGGKNTAEASWITEYVIPGFEKQMAAEGRTVVVKFEAQGVDDESYKTKIALDLQAGTGADVMSVDGIWVGEFAEAGYIKPLSEVAGPGVDAWDGWTVIPAAVQSALSFDGHRYGVPQGADGRVLYYNKALLARAGLPTRWQPTSWEEVLVAARALAKLPDVIPIQLNAGTAMGEASTMQGFLPMLVGTGEQIYEGGKWAGATPGVAKVLGLFKQIYVDEKLGDPILQQEAAGRENAFDLFSKGRIGILLEGDYFWRAVINPAKGVGTAPMADRDTVVGYACVPAIAPHQGARRQSFVSMSGGAGRVLNPSSKHPDLAWRLLAFMSSAEACERFTAGTVAITPRTDVNARTLAGDPMLAYVNNEVLPITFYRPGLAAYPEVSALLQQATLDVVTGRPLDEALAAYRKRLEDVVGADSVRNQADGR